MKQHAPIIEETERCVSNMMVLPINTIEVLKH